jgi:hypothetical protein
LLETNNMILEMGLNTRTGDHLEGWSAPEDRQ